jgi:hypothetical protein
LLLTVDRAGIVCPLVQFSAFQVRRNLGHIRPCFTDLHCTEMHGDARHVRCWAIMDCTSSAILLIKSTPFLTELSWAELSWAELSWADLIWSELNWAELNWAVPYFNAQSALHSCVCATRSIVYTEDCKGHKVEALEGLQDTLHCVFASCHTVTPCVFYFLWSIDRFMDRKACQSHPIIIWMVHRTIIVISFYLLHLRT